MDTIDTDVSRLLGIAYPIIVAPMFLVSNVDLVVAASEAGAIGTFPALNFRPIEAYRSALAEIARRTPKPFGVNVIVNQSNKRQDEDLRGALNAGAKLIITSLGNPKRVIEEAHKVGAKVFCDVTNLEHALKVEEQGADGVVAVAQGAGGHAGPVSPFVLIPVLKRRLKVPIIAAGAVAHGSAVAAALALGASGVSMGTRFIASTESGVDTSYKEAVVNAKAEDIVMTTRISGTPAAVIRTPYIEKVGTDLPWVLTKLKNHPRTKNYAVPLIHWMGMRELERSGTKPSWKNVWSAGQSVGLVDRIQPTKEIIAQLITEYKEAKERLR